MRTYKYPYDPIKCVNWVTHIKISTELFSVSFNIEILYYAILLVKLAYFRTPIWSVLGS